MRGEPAQGRPCAMHDRVNMQAPDFQPLPAIQSRIFVEDTVFFGVWGFKVPAIALQPLSMISWANCRASASAVNLRVARAHRRSPSSRLGVMFER